MNTFYFTSNRLSVSHAVSTRDLCLRTLTCARLLLLFPLASTVLTGSKLPVVVTWLAVIVIADILDGIVARRFRCDDNWRRIADATVDRITIHAAFLCALFVNADLTVLYLPLAARDAAALLGSFLCLTHRHTLIIGGGWHKLASLIDIPFFLCLLFAGQQVGFVMGIAALLVNYALLVDYVGTYLQWRETGLKSTDRLSADRMHGFLYLTSQTGKTTHQLPAARSLGVASPSN